MRKHLVWLVVIAACTAKAPTVGGGASPDAAMQAQSDAPAAAATVPVSGKTMDYFGTVALPATAVATDGLDPPLSTTSGGDGTYTLSAVAVASKLYLVTTVASYRPTRNTEITVADAAVMQDIYALSVQDVKNQYTSVGKTPTAGTAFVIAVLDKTNGTPLEGIPLTGIALLDANNQPVPNLSAYFFNAQGAIDAAVTTATAYGTPPVSRVALLDVPPGSYTLAVTYPAGMGGNTVDTTPISTAADGATLAVSGGMGSGGGGGPNPNPTFATDIYPRLQRAAQGGLGCANCHTANGPAAILPYDQPAATVLANMTTLQVVNLTTPASSLFLVRPLYEQPPTPQDHANATFLDINDPDYQEFLLWITQGAKP